MTSWNMPNSEAKNIFQKNTGFPEASYAMHWSNTGSSYLPSSGIHSYLPCSYDWISAKPACVLTSTWTQSVTGMKIYQPAVSSSSSTATCFPAGGSFNYIFGNISTITVHGWLAKSWINNSGLSDSASDDETDRRVVPFPFALSAAEKAAVAKEARENELITRSMIEGKACWEQTVGIGKCWELLCSAVFIL